MDAAQNASLEDQVEADMELHRTLCRLTCNETLLHSWKSLEGSIRMSIMFGGLERGIKNLGVDRHRDIVVGLNTGDASLAGQTIREHMDTAASNLVT